MVALKEITSSKNDLIKSLKKLHKKKYRDEANRYLIEGFHLVEEAVKAQVPLPLILIDDRGQREWGQWLETISTEKYLVSTDVMKSLSDLPTPQGILAVAEKPLVTHESFAGKGNWVLLDRVQDPGNVGTIIRTADAAGFAGVILGEGSADIYSTKVLRSMQGSHFHLPVISGDLSQIIPQLQGQGVKVYGTELNKEAVVFDELEAAQQVAILLGNEGQGVSNKLLSITDKNLYIPLYGQAESLNVAVAAGILMYHFVKKS